MGFALYRLILASDGRFSYEAGFAEGGLLFRLNEDWVWAGVVQPPGTSSPPLSDTELSKESENPVTLVITLPLRNEFRLIG